MTFSDKLDVTVNGESRELFMSFGLLNVLATMVDSPERVPMIPLDAELRTGVLAACIAKRKRSGKLIEDLDMDDVEVSVDDAEKTIEWAMMALSDFFIRAFRRVVKATEASQGELATLTRSLTGSPASAGATA